MDRKELFVTLKFSLGEAPSLSDLRKEGITLQDYTEDILEGLPEYILDRMECDEIEIKGTIKKVQDV